MSDVPGTNPPPPQSGATPPGWYDDPLDRYDHRWFDGTDWTSQVSDDGRPTIDPSGTSRSPAAAYSYQPQYGNDARDGFQPTTNAPTGRNGIAVAALVCGIIGVIIAWIPFLAFVGALLAVLAIVFGMTGLRRSHAALKGRGQAIAGIVLGAIAAVLAVLGIILTVVVWGALTDFIDPGPVETTVDECSVETGVATVSGTLTNDGVSEQSYTVFVVIDGTTSPVTVDDVAAGETVAWRAGVNVDVQDGACDPDIIVNGEFPWGVEIDPVE